MFFNFLLAFSWVISLFFALDMPRKNRATLSMDAVKFLKFLYLEKRKVPEKEFNAFAKYNVFITEALVDQNFVYLLNGGFIKYEHNKIYYIYITISGREFFELSTREKVGRYKAIVLWLLSGVALFFSSRN